MALLIQPNGDVSVVDRNQIPSAIGGHVSVFHCTKMKGANGKKYNYVIYCKRMTFAVNAMRLLRRRRTAKTVTC